MILILDNYDSFTYNLYQRVAQLRPNAEIKVIRNDLLAPQEAADNYNLTHLIISPGPCAPDQAGLSLNYVEFFHSKIPLLGICLGHQAIAQKFGAKIVRAKRIMHGKTSEIFHTGNAIFTDVENPFTAMRYHSLIADPENLDSEFIETSWTTDQKELMSIQSKSHPTFGLQFHPESFKSPAGFKLLDNFLNY